MNKNTKVAPKVSKKAPIVARPPAKASGPAFVRADLTVDGNLMSVVTASAKEFKTGSRGYYANGKVEIDGKRYQMQLQLVEIGSKPK